MAIKIGAKTVEHFAVVGVLHLLPLPGSARHGLPLEKILDVAMREAEIYVAAGIDAIIVENHGDAPFAKESVEPHVPAILALLVDRLKRRFGVPIGVNVLRNDAFSALAAAFAGGGDFIRVNVLTGVTATDQGLIEGAADRVQAYRKKLDPGISIFADAEVKFGTPLFRPSLPALVKSLAERALADAVIITGEATGSAPEISRLETARRGAPLVPLFVGSGATKDSIAAMRAHVDGVIVGSDFKVDGKVESPVDAERVRAFMRAARG